MAIQLGGGGDDYDFKGFAPGELDSMFSSIFKNPLSSYSVSFKLNTTLVNDSDKMDIEYSSPVEEKSVKTTFSSTPAFTYNPSAYGVNYSKRKASNPISAMKGAVVNVLKKICRDD